MAAQLEHPCFKGHPRAGGVFLKNHGQGLALEIIPVDVVLLLVLQLVRRIQDQGDVFLGQIQQL